MLDDKIFRRGISSIFAMHRSLRPLDAEESAIYYLALRENEPDVFINACKRVAENKDTPWNPVAAIKDEIDKLLGHDAESAYLLLDDLLERYYHPDFSKCSADGIAEKLAAMNRTELIPLLYRWGGEIYDRRNPTGTRAHFRDAYKAGLLFSGNGHKQLSNSNQPRLLGEILNANYNLEPKNDES